MKSLRKILALMLVLVLVLTACAGGSEENTDKPAEENEETEGGDNTGDEGNEGTEGETAETNFDDNSLYLITDLGTIDDKSFNQGTFEGLKQYADEIGIKANYIRPVDEGDANYLQAIDQAVEAGAKVVVTPGFLFENAVGQAQGKYPDIKFVAVDFVPAVAKDEFKVGDNTVSILFKEDQAGFLAGYAAVKEGLTELGFMGGVGVPPVIRYGFGFIKGADVAAEEMGVKVNMKYNYTGSFVEKPEIKTMAASWYQDGTEVIFSCGGGIYRSIISAAQDADKQIIGVDTDQKDEGEQVLTSAMKNLQKATYDAVKSIDEGNFKGGETLVLDVTTNNVQISDDFSRFENFTEDDYKAIYDKLMNNEDGLLDSIPQINTELEQNEQANPEHIEGIENVTIEYFK